MVPMTSTIAASRTLMEDVSFEAASRRAPTCLLNLDGTIAFSRLWDWQLRQPCLRSAPRFSKALKHFLYLALD
jgi:hypothetical protein